MAAVRLSTLIERLGPTMPVDEAVALGVLLLDKRLAPRNQDATSPAGVLFVRDDGVRVVARANFTQWLLNASAFSRELQGSRLIWKPDLPAPRATVFGLAALIYAALVARCPFTGATPEQLGKAIEQGWIIAPLTELRPDVPAELSRLVRRCLRPHGLERPEDLRSALLPFVSRHGLAVSRDTLFERAFEGYVARAEPADLYQRIRGGDEASRLVLADLLEERGELDQAEWLRAESRMQSASEREKPVLLRQLRALKPGLDANFVALVSRTAIENCPVRFGLKCPLRWESLLRTEDPLTRYCTGCDSNVHFVDSIEAARRAASEGLCIAIDSRLTRQANDLHEGPMMLGETIEID